MIMEYTIQVDNMKCHGCANTIYKHISSIPEVQNVQVNVATGCITLTSSEDAQTIVTQKLHQLGYPVRGSTTGLDHLRSQATAFVSCAIGKMTG
jgi:copper chaperone